MSTSRLAQLCCWAIQTGLFTSCWSVGVAAQAVEQPNKVFGLVIGISEYEEGGLRWLKYADKDAAWFEMRLAKLPSGQKWDRLAVLINDRATKEQIKEQFRYLEMHAGPEACVYVFISAAGFADRTGGNSPAGTGYLLGYRSSRELQRTLLTVDEIRQFLQKCAARVIIFADMCREILPAGPANLRSENEINSRILAMLRKEGRNGLLATRERQTSKEDTALRLGVFAHFLVEGLANTRTFASLIDFVTPRVIERVHELKFKGQEPYPVVRDPYLLLWNLPKVTQMQANIRPAFYQVAADQAQDQEPESGLTIRDRIMRQSTTAVLQLAEYAKEIPGSMTPQNLSEIATGLQERGQDILLRYLLGDRFPDDPLKPKATDFVTASRLLDAALDLRQRLHLLQFDDAETQRLRSLQLFSLGRSMIDEPGRALEAKESLEKSIRIDPKLAEPHNALGLLHLRLARDQRNELDQAAKEFQSAIALEPNWAYPRHNLALTLTELGKYTGAEQMYREAISRTPYYPYLYCNLALLLHRLNRLAEAARTYQEGIKVFNSQTAENARRISRLRAEGQFKDADYLATRLQLLRRYEAEAHNALGALRRSQGKADQATNQYEIALSLNPDLSAARHNLGVLLLTQYQHLTEAHRRSSDLLDRAIEQLSANAISIQPYHPSRTRLAEAYMLKQRYDAAEAMYRQSLSSDSTDSSTASGLAKALALQGRVDEGFEVLQRFMRQYPKPTTPFASFTIHEAAAELHELRSQDADACREHRLAVDALRRTLAYDQELRRAKLKLSRCR